MPSIDEDAAVVSTLERRHPKIRPRPTEESLDSIDDSASEVSSVMTGGDPDDELPEPDLDQEQLGDDVSINELVSSWFTYLSLDVRTRGTFFG